MSVKPTPDQAIQRLRLDDDLTVDLQYAIEQAHAQMLEHLDRHVLHADESELEAALATDPAHTGAVCTPSLIAAQLLLIDVLVGSNSAQERESKEEAAKRLMRPHVRMGS